MAIGILLYLAVIVFLIASVWKVFEKAGEPGWACLIPVYSFYVVCRFTGTKNWWLIFIPIANVVIAIIALINLAKSFGKSGAFAAGLFFLGFIFYPILGFGDAQYIGPAGDPVALQNFQDKNKFDFERNIA